VKDGPQLAEKLRSMRGSYLCFARDCKTSPTQSEHILFIFGIRVDEMNCDCNLSLVSIAPSTSIPISSEHPASEIRDLFLAPPAAQLNMGGSLEGNRGYGSGVQR
jgi:hypothetical protein